MDPQRAQQIADSPNMVNVTFNGTPVYIEHVDQGSGTATIHPLDNPKQKQCIPVTRLREHTD